MNSKHVGYDECKFPIRKSKTCSVPERETCIRQERFVENVPLHTYYSLMGFAIFEVHVTNNLIVPFSGKPGIVVTVSKVESEEKVALAKMSMRTGHLVIQVKTEPLYRFIFSPISRSQRIHDPSLRDVMKGKDAAMECAEM